MPTLTLVSNVFLPLGRAEARLFGIPDLPLVEVPHHPWGSVSAQEWQADAERAVTGIAQQLSAPLPALVR